MPNQPTNSPQPPDPKHEDKLRAVHVKFPTPVTDDEMQALVKEIEAIDGIAKAEVVSIGPIQFFDISIKDKSQLDELIGKVKQISSVAPDSVKKIPIAKPKDLLDG